MNCGIVWPPQHTGTDATEELPGHAVPVIFRRALPFVYGLTNSGQKPERQQYTDTD